MDNPERSASTLKYLQATLRSPKCRDTTLHFIKDYPGDCRLVLPILRDMAATQEVSYEDGAINPESLARALAAAGADGVPALRELAARADAAVKREALSALGRVADPAGVGAAVEALVSHLRADDPEACSEALEALGRLGPKAAAAVPHVIPFLSHPRGDGPNLSGAAAYAVEHIGEPAAAAAPALLAALADPALAAAAHGRHQVIRALGELGPAAAPAIPSLLRIIDEFLVNDAPTSTDDLEATCAVYALAGIRRPTPEVLAMLDRAWRTPGCSIARNAPVVIAMLDPDDPRPLAWALDEIEAAADPEAKADAICTLGVMRPDGRGIRELLAVFAADENLQVRIAAEVVLERLPPDGP